MQINLHTKKTDSDIENKLTVTKVGQGGGVDKLRVCVKRYT